MSEYDNLFIKLQEYLLQIELRYIEPHRINSATELKSDYELDVKAYCVLSHAAFEEFVESIVINVMDKAIDKFKNLQQISYPLICLTTLKDTPEKELEDKVITFDLIPKHLTQIKDKFSNDIINNNHGVSIKYLKNLLIPIGIDIPKDVNMRNSLTQLANARGSYAHNFSNRRIKNVLSPEDSANYVQDICDMMEIIVKSANGIKFFKYK